MRSSIALKSIVGIGQMGKWDCITGRIILILGQTKYRIPKFDHVPCYTRETTLKTSTIDLRLYIRSH